MYPTHMKLQQKLLPGFMGYNNIDKNLAQKWNKVSEGYINIS